MCDHVEYGAITAITSSQDLTIDLSFLSRANAYPFATRFIEGIMRCRGPARAIDQVALHAEMKLGSQGKYGMIGIVIGKNRYVDDVVVVVVVWLTKAEHLSFKVPLETSHCNCLVPSKDRLSKYFSVSCFLIILGTVYCRNM